MATTFEQYLIEHDVDQAGKPAAFDAWMREQFEVVAVEEPPC